MTKNSPHQAARGILGGTSSSAREYLQVALIIFGLLAPGWVRAAGTWTPLIRTAPGQVGLMLLLSDGTVMAANSGTSSTWYRLTPDINGSYVNGSWTTLAPMNKTRLYYSSQVLMDGRVFVAGGEYGTGKTNGETYNPVSNTWTAAPNPGHTFSDSNSEILPDGRVLVALVEGSLRGTILFNPVANAWTLGPTCIGIHNESAWVKLPDDSILFVDRNTTSSERYIPSLNQWIADATVPVALYDPYGLEKGAGLLLPNGKAFFLGSLGHTAIYTPSGSTASGTWVAGPDIPSASGCPDAPAAMMVNGKILCAVSPIPTSANHFPSPTTFYEYDYVANAFSSVPTPTGGTLNHPCFYGTMLVLPNGTVLYTDFNSQIYSYQSTGAPLAAGKPAIASITQNGDGSYHLAGTQFNGISEGSAYGDDNQNASNYPLVRLTDGSGHVYFARTYNWSSTSVMTSNRLVSTEFSVPATVPAGTYSLMVVANGISSDPIAFSTNSLAAALEGSGLTWTTGGTAFWAAQTAVSHDGVDAAQSGTIGNSQDSWVETTVTGPGTLTFWWKVSSESTFDYLEFYVNGVLQGGRISGEVDWQQQTLSIASGSKTLRWRYTKNASLVSGQDRAWLDQVSFNSAPALANIESGALGYTENQTATRVTATLTVSDADSANLASGTVSITSGFASGQDALSLNASPPAGIATNYNASTGVLTLSGSSGAANYQAALRSVTYRNTSENPSTATRTVSFNVNDGAAASNTQARNITVTAVNDAPTLTTVSALPGATEDTAFTISFATLGAASNTNDVDSGNLQFRIEAVSSGTLTKGGSAVVPGTTLLGSGESMVWTPATNANGTLNAFTVKAWDGSLASATAVQVQVQVAAVNDAPVLVPIADQVVLEETLLTFTASAADPDVGQTLLFSLNPTVPEGASINATNGVFTWTPSLAYASTTNSITLRVMDDGSPVAFDTHAVNVIVLARPRLLDIAEAPNGSFTLVWRVYPGRTYRFQSKDNLTNSTWTALGAEFVAATPSVVTTNDAGTNLYRFFRLIESQASLQVGLIAHYAFDEQCTNSAAGCVKDSSGLGNDGTLGSATSGTMPQAPMWTANGRFAGAYLYNGIVQPGDIVATIGQGIYLPQGVDVDGNWTLSVWATLNNVTNNTSGTIYSQKESTEDCRNLIIHWEGDDDQTMTLQVRDSACHELILHNLPSNPMVAGQWYHLVGVGNNKTYSFYINGVLQQSQLVSNMGSLSCNSHTIGMMFDNGGQYYNHYLNGSVDELRIYSRALSASEILALYNQGGGSFP